MTDLTARLVEDIRLLHGEEKRAREVLRHTEISLPNRWRELEELDIGRAELLRAELERPEAEDKASPGAESPVDTSGDADVEPEAQAGDAEPEAEASPKLKQLSRAKQVRPAIKSALRLCDDEFNQNDMELALELDGYYVNRSTLRGNLLEMSKLRDGVRLVKKGGGRSHPTIYGKA